MNAVLILKTLRDQGFTVSLLGDDRVFVRPKGVLDEAQRNLIRANKAGLLELLRFAANDPEPPADPKAWRELARAYNAHHWQCPTCKAGGQGRGLRCGVGMALWSHYQDAP